MKPVRGYSGSFRGFIALVLSLFVLLDMHVVNGADDIRCYSCSEAWTIKRCVEQNPQQTCGFGKVCYTIVTRGGFRSVKYDKGCMKKSHCMGLQSLNDRKNCQRNPSICVYCCANSLCNSGPSFNKISDWTAVVFCALLSATVSGMYPDS